MIWENVFLLSGRSSSPGHLGWTNYHNIPRIVSVIWPGWFISHKLKGPNGVHYEIAGNA
jgi:hypothetical protein